MTRHARRARGQFDILKMEGFTEWLDRQDVAQKWRNGPHGQHCTGWPFSLFKPPVDIDLKVAFYDKVLILNVRF